MSKIWSENATSSTLPSFNSTVLPVNFEIKARTDRPRYIREILMSHEAEFIGTDYQLDTYFRIDHGRLKLRQGNIENSLIHYIREDCEGPRESHVLLYEVENSEMLKKILCEVLPVLIEVSKKRQIYFIGNVKFHIDDVEGLGTFVEIEAIDDESLGSDKTEAQCRFYQALLDIHDRDLLSESYSDLLLGHQSRQ